MFRRLTWAYPMEFDDGKPIEDYEYPEPDDDDVSELLDCPHCGGSIYEDAVECPICGHYVSHSTDPWMGRPIWWLIIGVFGIASTILVLSCAI